MHDDSKQCTTVKSKHLATPEQNSITSTHELTNTTLLLQLTHILKNPQTITPLAQ